MALTLNVRGLTYLTTSGTTWTNTTNVDDGVYGQNLDTFATWSSTTSGASGYIEVGGFDCSSIPSTATITAVTLRPRHYLSANIARMSSINATVWDNTTQIGGNLAATKQLAVATDALAMSTLPTLAQLQSANFKVRMTWTRASVTTACNGLIDVIDMSVSYDLPAVTRPVRGTMPGVPVAQSSRW